MIKFKTDLFTLAEMQLKKEERISYTISDVIDYATKIRKFLDTNQKKIKKIIKLTKQDKKEYRRNYYQDHLKESKEYYHNYKRRMK